MQFPNNEKANFFIRKKNPDCDSYVKGCVGNDAVYTEFAMHEGFTYDMTFDSISYGRPMLQKQQIQFYEPCSSRGKELFSKCLDQIRFFFLNQSNQ